MERRTFLTGVAASGAALCAPTAIGGAFGKERATHCVIRESGSATAWPMVIGALFTDSVERHDSEIEQLREAIGYRRRLKFSSTDVARIPFARALIDHFIGDRRLQFRALIVSNVNNEWPADSRERDLRYVALYRKLLRCEIPPTGMASIDPPTRTSPRNERLRESLAMLSGQPATGRSELTDANTAQLAALLAGCVRAAITGVSSPTQQAILDHLNERLGASVLARLDLDKIEIRPATA